MKFLIFAVGFLAMITVEAFEFSTSFARGKWNANDFVMVKGPRWENFGSWAQMDDHIVQNVPEDASEKDLQTRMHSEAYVAMCFAKKIKMAKKVICSSTMSFDYRMAPLIVIAPELGKNDQTGVPEFREHWEIVLYDKGINVWHHTWEDGKPAWVKFSYLLENYLPKTPYQLQCTITDTPKGQMLEVECNGKKFGCFLPDLGKEFYLGIIGCEGRNRFYDFKIAADKGEALTE